jgi:hypothetical protein
MHTRNLGRNKVDNVITRGGKKYYKQLQNMLGMVVHTYNPNHSGSGGRMISNSGQTRQKGRKTLSQKQNTNKRAADIAQVVEHFLACVRPWFQFLEQ